MRIHRLLRPAILPGMVLSFYAPYLHAQAAEQNEVTYADMADLADAADLVARVQVTRIAQVEPERAPGVSPGLGRFYIEANTKALLTAKAPLGEKVEYLVDLDFASNGGPPKLKKREVLVFARRISGNPSALQLVAPDAQLLWSVERETRLRSILEVLRGPDPPPRITGVRELLYVPGNLKGEGRTQIFLKTHDGSGAAITVKRYPGAAPIWGVSFSELVAGFGDAPVPRTIEWYRLACFLPRDLPAGTNLSATEAASEQAAADYQLVLNALGPCGRMRGSAPGNSPAHASTEALHRSNAPQVEPRRDRIGSEQTIANDSSPVPAGRTAMRRVQFDTPGVATFPSLA